MLNKGCLWAGSCAHFSSGCWFSSSLIPDRFVWSQKLTSTGMNEDIFICEDFPDSWNDDEGMAESCIPGCFLLLLGSVPVFLLLVRSVLITWACSTVTCGYVGHEKLLHGNYREGKCVLEMSPVCSLQGDRVWRDAAFTETAKEWRCGD